MTTRDPSYARQLATVVKRKLSQPSWRLKGRVPTIKLLVQLFDTAYAVSLKTEEDQRLRCTLALMDRWFWLNGDKPRKRVMRCYPFGRPKPKPMFVEFGRWLPFEPNNLIKLSQAADPSVSIVAVGENDEGQLVLFGLWDQILHASRFLSREVDKPSSIPGELLCAIEGPGRLSVYRGFRFVAGLDRIKIVKKLSNPITAGPIRKALLLTAISRITSEVSTVEKDYKAFTNLRVHTQKWLLGFLEKQWLNVVARVVDGIKRYGHGGAVVMTSSRIEVLCKQVNVKYAIPYDRLSLAFGGLCRLEANRYLGVRVGAKLRRSRAKDKRDQGEGFLRFHESTRASDDLEHVRSTIEGAIAFIASLSRVDGLVLCDMHLNVYGFGVEVVLKDDPPGLMIATDALVTSMVAREITSFGMRHRSMMRLCWNNPGAVGFVVSQDGDIRVFTRLRDKLLMWDNVDLRQLWIGQSWA